MLEGEKYSSGKKSKERLTVMLCVNMCGEFEKPLVIGKSRKPRCFKNIDVKSLNVVWESNRKAWMTSRLMTEWLHDFDQRIKKKKRYVILFLDNATSHPNLKLRNVKLVFLPANTTTHCQPLDQGIVQNFKIRYRRLLLTRVLSLIDKCESADELAKKVNVLDAVIWTVSALKEIESSCVAKCFQKAGFNFKVESDEAGDDDEVVYPSVNDLMQKLPAPMQCDDEGYESIDNDLCTEEMEDDITAFIPTEDENGASDDDDGNVEISDAVTRSTVTNFSNALDDVKNLILFACEQGDADGLHYLEKLQMHYEKQLLTKKSHHQTKISDFLKS